MLVANFLIVLNVISCISGQYDDAEEAGAFLELSQLNYEDFCIQAANSEWLLIQEPSNVNLQKWETNLVDYGEKVKAEKCEVAHNVIHNKLDEQQLYKYETIVKAGDSLLPKNDWKELVSFRGTTILRRAAKINLNKAKDITQYDAEYILSHSGTVEAKKETWTTWHKGLMPLVNNYTQNLKLIKHAANENEIESVSKYWELLSGDLNGYRNINTQWIRISSLHEKLVRFVKQHLSMKYRIKIENETIPAYLLGSLQGYDWTKIDVTPFNNLTYEIRKNLWKNKYFGRSNYELASALGNILFNQVPEKSFWEHSQFNKYCPSRLINFCKEGAMRVSTCSEASISNFLTAHKNVGKVIVNQISARNTPILNIVNRYSGVEEGISELFSIISASPAWLNTKRLMRSTNDDNRQIVSLFITALDVLPRLAYYLSADMWRIKAIEDNITNSENLTSLWWKYRYEYERIVSDVDNIPAFLNDNHITSNKPYLPKFLGVIIGFQLYEFMMDSTEVKYDRISYKQTESKLINMLTQGSAENWMKMLNEYLEIDEVTSDAMINFFEPLENYLDELEEKTRIYRYNFTEEAELEKIEKQTIEEINTSRTPITTTSTSSSTVKQRIMNTTPKTDVAATNNKSQMSIVSNSGNFSKSTSKDIGRPLNNESTSKIQNSSDDQNDQSLESSNSKDVNGEMSGSRKAVWAVAAVLIGTVTICIIAIFGLQRCRKTPKNRRYV